MDTFGRAQRVVRRRREGEGGAPEAYVNKRTADALQECKAHTAKTALSLNGNVFDAKKKRITNVGTIVNTTDACSLYSLTTRVPMFKRDNKILIVDMKGARVVTVALPQGPQDAVNKAYADNVVLMDYKKAGVLGVRKRRLVDLATPQEPQDACTKAYVDSMMTDHSPIDVTQTNVMKMGNRRLAEVLPPEEEDDACTRKYVEDHFMNKNIMSVDEKHHPDAVQVYNRRLINVAQPTDSQDAVTLSYMRQALVTALSALTPVSLLTIESLYPHPPLNPSLPGKWYMLPTGRTKFVIPCDGTLALRNAAPLLMLLAVYVDVDDYHKLPPPLKLTMNTPFRVKKGQTLAFRLLQESPTAHMDDYHLYLLFEYRMALPLTSPLNTREL